MSAAQNSESDIPKAAQEQIAKLATKNSAGG